MEIERVVMECDAVAEAAAVAYPDKVLGEKVSLFVSAVDPKKTDSGQIAAFCKKRLPFYKVPAEVRVLAALPKNSLGKVDKKKLRAL